VTRHCNSEQLCEEVDAWLQVSAAAAAQQQLQRELSISQHPSLSGERFAEQIAAAEAAQEALSSELEAAPPTLHGAWIVAT
jgi:hypothetical protein